MPRPLSIDLRRNFAQLEPFLRTNPNSVMVRKAAHELAKAIGSRELVQRAQALPTIQLVGRHGVSSPTARDEAFDQATCHFISAAQDALSELEQHEQRVATNKNLTRPECRALVLADLMKHRDLRWASDVADSLCLTDEQVLDAYEQLEYEGAIEGPKSAALRGEPAWAARLNAHGRNLADGSGQAAMASQVVFNQQFHHSNIANAGVAHELITQHVAVFPVIPDDVREILQGSENGAALIEGLDEGMRQSPPPVKVLRGLVTGIRTLIESANVATEVAAHGHEWLTAVSQWLSAIHS